MPPPARAQYVMGRSSLSSPRQRPRLSLDIPSRRVSPSPRQTGGGDPSPEASRSLRLAPGCGHVGLQLCRAPALRAGRVRRREQRAHDDVLRRGCAAVESALPCGVLLAEDAQVDAWDEGLGLERLARDRRPRRRPSLSSSTPRSPSARSSCLRNMTRRGVTRRVRGELEHVERRAASRRRARRRGRS